jgi:hypothetical protein
LAVDPGAAPYIVHDTNAGALFHHLGVVVHGVAQLTGVPLTSWRARGPLVLAAFICAVAAGAKPWCAATVIAANVIAAAPVRPPRGGYRYGMRGVVTRTPVVDGSPMPSGNAVTAPE